MNLDVRRRITRDQNSGVEIVAEYEFTREIEGIFFERLGRLSQRHQFRLPDRQILRRMAEGGNLGVFYDRTRDAIYGIHLMYRVADQAVFLFGAGAEERAN